MSALARKLQIERNGRVLKEVNLEEGKPLSMGRDRACELFLEDPKISRKHAEIRVIEGKLELAKIAEFSPLLVNGRDVTGTLIQTGDVVELGSYLIRVMDAGKSPQLALVEKKEAHVLVEAPPLFVETSEPPSPPAPSVDTPLPAPVVEARQGPMEVLSVDPKDSLNLAEPILASSEISPDQISEPVNSEWNASQEPANEVGDAVDPFSSPEALAGVGENLEMESASPAPEEEKPIEMEGAQDAVGGERMTGSMTSMFQSTAEARLILRRGNASSENYVIRSGTIVAGRDKDCDIILDEKKSSRKQFKIYRNGNRYFIQDLGSSNGTYVNQKRITEASLSSEDRIRVGETEFQFVAQEESFEEKARDFLPVEKEITAPLDGSELNVSPMSLTPDGSTSGGGLSPSGPMGFEPAQQVPSMMAGMGGPAPVAPKKNQGMIDKYIRNFGTLPWYKKVIVVIVVGTIAYTGLEEEINDFLGLTPRKPLIKKKTAKPAVNPNLPKDPRASLAKDKREFIERQYELAFDYYKKRDYDKTLYELQGIFQIMPEDERSRELERYANEGKRKIELLEKEKRAAEEAEKRAQKIQDLVKDAGKLMIAKRYDEAKAKFAEILGMDPENTQISVWQKEIDAYYEEIAMKEHAAKVRLEIEASIKSKFRETSKLQEEKRYHEAIKAYQLLLNDKVIQDNDPALIEKIKGLIKMCQEEIEKMRAPLLVAARAHEKENDLATAYREYEQATIVDPPHPEGYEGMDRIREVLEAKSKVLYSEGSVAEGYTEFEVAKKKFEEILKVAPRGSLYYERAARKLKVYKMFEKVSGLSAVEEDTQDRAPASSEEGTTTNESAPAIGSEEDSSLPPQGTEEKATDSQDNQADSGFKEPIAP